MENTIQSQENATAKALGLKLRMVFGVLYHPKSVPLVPTKSILEMVNLDCHSTVKSAMIATQDIKSP
jgi:hypothetical protein